MIAFLFRKSLPRLADLCLEGSAYQSGILLSSAFFSLGGPFPSFFPFNVDVQKLLFGLFCAHSSEDWLRRTVQNREKREAGLLPANIKLFILYLAQAECLINIQIHFVICISIYQGKRQV